MKRTSRLTILGVLCVAVFIGGCATRPKQYAPPDNAKVQASTRQVKADVAKTHEIARDARQFVTAAQKDADTIVVGSTDLEGKTAELAKVAPDELKPQILELTTGISELQKHEESLVQNLVSAQKKNDELEAHLAVTDSHVTELEQNQASYYRDALQLANTATEERNGRIAVEKKLSWYRWHWWGSWIVLGVGIIACVVVAIIKWGAKWSAKVAVAAGKVGI